MTTSASSGPSRTFSASASRRGRAGRQAGKLDKVNELKTAINETERQLDMAQENFEKISRTIKKEFEVFEAKKNQDFKHTIVKYLEKMLKAQENQITHWEKFLPEIKQMEV